MSASYNTLAKDLARVGQISIVPNILEVVCRATGMGFAAVARVTHDHWIACSVLDEIGFGLKPGGELQIETTICNEIRDSRQAVVIDHVAEDAQFANHHTPKMYGFQSYISVPVILKNGEFFGTLCAIDPRPAKLNNVRIVGMFNLFAELIAFHLQNLELMERSSVAVQDLNRQLSDSQEENRQYQYISSHNLQEPLRKLRVFTDMMVVSAGNGDMDRVKDLALRTNASAQKFSMMIQDVSQLSNLHRDVTALVAVDLNKVVSDVCAQLDQLIQAKQVVLKTEALPRIEAVPAHLEQLFYQLIHNAVKFSKDSGTPHIHITARNARQEQIASLTPATSETRYMEIRVEDNGIGIDPSQLNRIFDIFYNFTNEPVINGFGIGLSYCRKIVNLLGGSIHATSTEGEGTIISFILPVLTGTSAKETNPMSHQPGQQGYDKQQQ